MHQHHPFLWIYQNRDFLAALTGIAIAVLTLLLLIFNIIYVRANLKTVRIMERDLRYRTKPIPTLSIDMANDGGWINAALKLHTMNAPLKIKEIKLSFPQEDHRHTHEVYSQAQNRILRLGEVYEFSESFFPSAKTTSWSAVLIYADLAGMANYKTSFSSSDPFLGYEEILEYDDGRPTFMQRLVERLRFRRHL